MADPLAALFSALTPLWGMSLTGAYAVGIVLVLRLVLRNRAPRQAVCLLWLIVFARLLLPISLESPLSLIPPALTDVSAAQTVEPDGAAAPTQPDGTGEDAAVPPETVSAAPSGGPVTQPVSPGTAAQSPGQPIQLPGGAGAAFPWQALAAGVWLAGAAAMAGYALVSWLLLRRRLFDAVRAPDGAWEHPNLAVSFLLGVFRPRIYLPARLPAATRFFVLAHERAHLRRGDHIVKPVCWLALSLHWFNPAAWLAFFLLSRDLEVACDQSVVRRLGSQVKADYSAALLSAASARRFPAPCPLAFGGNDARGRIRNVLRYRRPALWILAAAAIAVTAAAVCLLTDPIARADHTPDPGGFSVEPLGSPSGGTHTRFQLVYEGRETEFSGTALADTEPYTCMEDLNADGIPELIAVFTTLEDASRFLQEVHVFDSQTLTEYPCGAWPPLRAAPSPSPPMIIPTSSLPLTASPRR